VSHMSNFIRTLPLTVLALCGILMSQTASAEIKVGVVDFQRLVQDAPQTKTAMQTLENEFGPRRRELLTMQNDLKSKEDKMQKEGAIMAEADRAKAEKSFRDEQREFSRKGGEFQDDLSQRRNEELAKVQRFFAQEIAVYANAQGFDLVVGEGVFFSKPALDITAQVLEVLKTKPATVPAVAAPGAAAPAAPKPPAKPANK
jgi:outer membrane protein